MVLHQSDFFFLPRRYLTMSRDIFGDMWLSQLEGMEVAAGTKWVQTKDAANSLH